MERSAKKYMSFPVKDKVCTLQILSTKTIVEYNIYRPTLNRKAIRHGGTQVPGPLHKTCKFKYFKRILKTKVLQQTRSGWKEKTIFIDSIVD